MSQENPYWPNGAVPGETYTRYIKGDNEEDIPGLTGICFRDGIYFCEDPECTHFFAPLIRGEVRRLNFEYQRNEDILSGKIPKPTREESIHEAVETIACFLTNAR